MADKGWCDKGTSPLLQGVKCALPVTHSIDSILVHWPRKGHCTRAKQAMHTTMNVLNKPSQNLGMHISMRSPREVRHLNSEALTLRISTAFPAGDVLEDLV
jgi:hypothetical protein